MQVPSSNEVKMGYRKIIFCAIAMTVIVEKNWSASGKSHQWAIIMKLDIDHC